MKKSITILLLLCSIGVMGQETSIKIGSGLKYEGATLVPTPGNGKTVFYSDIESDTDTTVLNSGDATTIHLHEWAYNKMQFSRNTCAVYHGDLGCPNNWPVSFRICSLCLRHEKISTTYRYVYKVDKYDENLKKIDQ